MFTSIWRIGSTKNTFDGVVLASHVEGTILKTAQGRHVSQLA